MFNFNVNLCYIKALKLSVVSLERALQQYTLEPSEKPFDLKTIPIDVPVESSSKNTDSGINMGISLKKEENKPSATRQDIYAGSYIIYTCNY